MGERRHLILNIKGLIVDNFAKTPYNIKVSVFISNSREIYRVKN